MKFTSRSRDTVTHASVVWHDSKEYAGVRYAIRRVSLSQRIELIDKVRSLLQRHEFLKAGDSSDQLEANLGELLIRKLYLEWGLVALENLTIDDEQATVPLLIEKGPDSLTDEIITAIRGQLELTTEERKNS